MISSAQSAKRQKGCVGVLSLKAMRAGIQAEAPQATGPGRHGASHRSSALLALALLALVGLRLHRRLLLHVGRKGEVAGPQQAARGHVEHLVLQRHKLEVDASGGHPELPAVDHGGHQVALDLARDLVKLALRGQRPREHAEPHHWPQRHLVQKHFPQEVGGGLSAKSAVQQRVPPVLVRSVEAQPPAAHAQSALQRKRALPLRRVLGQLPGYDLRAEVPRCAHRTRRQGCLQP
mmetsp:Transcript_41787/g.106941  ORF Transcript_41787/g.106941 Transcript_41787/m.106941 type:complete len:234 (+) Transcript_41787:1055-1756(+)